MSTQNNIPALSELQQAVQHNCAISDARYSRDYSLCIYLLRLREFYRWQNGIPPGGNIDQQTLGDWVSDTEAHWDEIEETDYQPLVIDGERFAPFDTDAINEKIGNSGLHYSAGIGRLGQPHFVLAQQLRQSTGDNYTCIELGEELARDTITLPAMMQNTAIHIRHQSFSQLIWQMFDEWNLYKAAGPMARLVDHYNLSHGPQLEESIQRASDELSQLLIQHELGEIEAGKLLGPDYQAMTHAFHRKPGEMQLRAIRDLLADSLHSWPFIASEKSTVLLDFWQASLNGYREKYFNMANPKHSLGSDEQQTRLEHLANMIDTEQTRWQQVGAELLSQYQSNGTDFNVDETLKSYIQ